MFGRFEQFSNPLPETSAQQPPQTLWAFFRFSMRGFVKPLLALALVTALLAGVEVILFKFVAQLVDLLGTHPRETFFQDEAPLLIGMSLLVLLLGPALVFLHAALYNQSIFINHPLSMQWMLHRYLLQQSYSFYQDEFSGRLATKITQTVDALRDATLKFADVLLYVLVYLVGMIGLILAADWRLCIPFAIWAVLYVVLLKLELPKLKQYAADQAHARSDLNGRIVDSYTNFATVKLFSHSNREAEYVRSAMTRFLDAVRPLMRHVSRLIFNLWILNFALIFATCATSILLWQKGHVTIGAITIAMTLTLRLKMQSQFIMFEISNLSQQMGTVTDGMNSLSKPLAVTDTPEAKPLSIRQGRVQFKDIDFHYPGAATLFDHFNLDIKPGEKIGLVGRSGAGKSTLTHLLLRLYDPNGGCILIDDQRIDSIQQESLRAQIGVVTQDTSLLHRSIRDNLLYGRPDATEAEMHAAARMTQIDEFIEALPDGYDTLVGERGIKLSGGQRQRLAIARVLLKNAPILILDEATSALDSEVEEAIQNNLNQLMQDKTVVAIAHRLSTIAEMDRLIVLDHGEIVEQGSHEQLLRQNGLYASLWQRQSGGFVGVD